MKKLIIPVFLILFILTSGYSQDPAVTPPPSAPPATTPPPATTTPPATTPPATTTTAAVPPQETTDDRGLMFGLKLTPTYCWFTLDRTDFDSDGGIIGYTYGIMTDFRLAPNYYIASGIEISQRGGKYKSDFLIQSAGHDTIPNTFAKGTITQRLQFIDIPLSLKLKTKEIGYSRYYGSFGFLMGFNIKANQDVDYADPVYEDRDKRDNMSDYGAFNFGLLLGLGMEYKFSGNTAVTFGAQYHNAFTDIWAEDDAKLTSNFVSLNIGLFF